MKKAKAKWRAVVTKKRDVLVFRIANVLRECDWDWERILLVEKAAALCGSWGIVDKLRGPKP